MCVCVCVCECVCWVESPPVRVGALARLCGLLLRLLLLLLLLLLPLLLSGTRQVPRPHVGQAILSCLKIPTQHLHARVECAQRQRVACSLPWLDHHLDFVELFSLSSLSLPLCLSLFVSNADPLRLSQVVKQIKKSPVSRRRKNKSRRTKERE